MSHVVLFTNGCPRCKSLEALLHEKDISYDTYTDIEGMKRLGLTEAPALKIDELIQPYDDAIQWVKNQMTVEDWLGNDNQLGIDIWHKKYQRGNETFEDWLNRVSGGDNEVAQLIRDKKFLFGGRILANRGVPVEEEKVSLSNCYVIAPPNDSIESIYDTCKKLARTYSYGGGCGIDISKLAPTGAKVHNQAKSTSGAVSFMDTFSQVTEQIGQHGRRGALMISMRCDHPDIEKFITIKSDLAKVNYANISVMVTDDFMRAVENNEDWVLSFTRPETKETIERTVKAEDLFNLLCEQNWNYAEPGMLFWNRIENYNLLSNNKDFHYAGVNPCAEEPLPSGGSCLLSAINLANFIYNKEFNWTDFKTTIKTVVRAANDVLDEGLTKHPLKEQQETVRTWRQIGIGIMGLADCLIKLELRYGAQESIDLCNKIGEILAQCAIEESAELACQYGVYDGYSNEVINSTFFENHATDYLIDKVNKFGLRNSQLLTIAPTGTISTMLGVSGGMEPIFANSYTRTTKSLHGQDVQYKVYTPIVNEYMQEHNISNESQLPNYFVTSADLTVKERIAMQSVWQKHIDASISSTVNLPNEATIEDVKNIYMDAWKYGLKGITVYRAGCAREGILTTDNKDKHNNNELELKRGMLIDVPEDLTYRKYKLLTGCGKLYIFVGVDDDGNIYDVFTNTDGTGGCTVNTQANSRLLSACIRGGVPIEYIIEQLGKSGTCPSFQYARGKGKQLSRGKSCPSAIAEVLKTIFEESQEQYSDLAQDINDGGIQEEDIQHSNICPDCGSVLVAENGCNICKNCGWSKCAL